MYFEDREALAVSARTYWLLQALRYGNEAVRSFTELRQCFLVCRQVHKDIADSLERSGHCRANNANGHSDGIKAPRTTAIGPVSPRRTPTVRSTADRIDRMINVLPPVCFVELSLRPDESPLVPLVNGIPIGLRFEQTHRKEHWLQVLLRSR